MLLTCSRAECGVEFRARHARPYCCMACSAQAHRAPSRRCACGKLLVRYQRVACSPQCAGRIRGGNGAELHTSTTREAVRALWDQEPQLSAREIGAVMRPAMTKNAVIGMARRCHFPSRPSPIGGSRPRTTLPALVPVPVEAARKPPQRAPQRAPEPPTAPSAPTRRPEAEMLLPRAGTPPRWGRCQFPTGERPYRWCGEPVQQVGNPYCNDCRKIAYNRPAPMRDGTTADDARPAA
jgi:hypothetical protein